MNIIPMLSVVRLRQLTDDGRSRNTCGEYNETCIIVSKTPPPAGKEIIRRAGFDFAQGDRLHDFSDVSYYYFLFF
ncbi:MAG: hypothetical protein KKG06_01260 [Bacteroidetes bacterium]|nr:hypothetical protein [Bacteroidota bacterium]